MKTWLYALCDMSSITSEHYVYFVPTVLSSYTRLIFGSIHTHVGIRLYIFFSALPGKHCYSTLHVGVMAITSPWGRDSTQPPIYIQFGQ